MALNSSAPCRCRPSRKEAYPAGRRSAERDATVRVGGSALRAGHRYRAPTDRDLRRSQGAQHLRFEKTRGRGWAIRLSDEARISPRFEANEPGSIRSITGFRVRLRNACAVPGQVDRDGTVIDAGNLAQRRSLDPRPGLILLTRSTSTEAEDHGAGWGLFGINGGRPPWRAATFGTDGVSRSGPFGRPTAEWRAAPRVRLASPGGDESRLRRSATDPEPCPSPSRPP